MLKDVRGEFPGAVRTSPRVVAFASGRTVALDSGASDRLMVSDPDGRFEIAIRFTEAGPVLEVEAIGLNVRSDAAVVVDCDRFHVHAREQITLESKGDLVERVAGDRRSVVEGGASVTADAVEIVAQDGEVEITASEDTRIDGRRVLLNC